MSIKWLDILIVFLLIILNGLFAMAEIAIISARKARLKQWSEEGDRRAFAALELANSPTLLLSTAQIGITVIGVLSGAFGGATLAAHLEEILNRYPLVAPYSHPVSLGAVVVFIAYFSLVLGELIPKRLALNDPERIASIAASPMRWLSRAASPAVRLLSASTDTALRLAGISPSSDPPVTEEEIKLLIEQGTLAGVFEEAEQEMMERILRLGDRRVGVLMTPRKRIVWLNTNEALEKTRSKIAESIYSRFPVCQGRLRNVLGIVHVRDILAANISGKSFNLASSAQPPLFVIESMHVLRVMELFRQSGTQMALVVDEYGTIEGLVTLNDILEAIIGDIPSVDEAEEPRLVERKEGSWLVEGMLPIDELKELFDIRKLPDEQAGYYQTLGGFAMTCLKRVPSEGDFFECCGLKFEIVDMDGHMVNRVLISRIEQQNVDGVEPD